MGQFFEELKRRNVLRVAIAYLAAAWLLIQIVETLFPIFGLDDALIRLVTILLVIGFPLILIFSWLLELTPDGLTLERDVDRSRFRAYHSGKNLDRAIIVVLTMALGFFAIDKFVLDPARDTEMEASVAKRVRSEVFIESFGQNSIAVLPFVNMSDDASNEYFSDGISEELLNLLAQNPQLRVISRSSAFSFKGKDIAIPLIAEQLHVESVLEGSVRKVGNRVRITAQLIEARSDSHLWSETYDRTLDDIFAVQNEIAAEIVLALRTHLEIEVDGVPRVAAAATSDAHDAYLRGRYLVVQRTRTTVEAAVREYERAIALDPDYALAHAEMAIATLFLTRYGGLTVREAVAAATPHVERAIALDPTLAEAHAAGGYVLRFQARAEEALTHFRRAVHINPNYALVYNAMGVLLGSYLGHYDEAFAAFETALLLDPLSIAAMGNYINQLIARDRLVEADRELEKLASIAPSFYMSVRATRTSLGGKWANQILSELEALRINPGRLFSRNALAQGFAIIGLEKEALAMSEAPEPVVLRLLGRPGDAIMAAEARVADDPISLTARSALGLALASDGEYARARPILEEMWQRSGGRITRGGLFRTTTASALIAARGDNVDKAAIDELAAAIKDNVLRYRDAGISRGNRQDSADFEEGLAAFLTGERERGLELIAKAVKDGFFVPPREAYLQTLYDDPGFTSISARQRTQQDHERDRFLAIVCADNLYAAVWLPADGTCEWFAAARGK